MRECVCAYVSVCVHECVCVCVCVCVCCVCVCSQARIHGNIVLAVEALLYFLRGHYFQESLTQRSLFYED